MAVPLNIAGPSYESVTQNNAQQLVNWYVEGDETGGKFAAILRPTPGLKAVTASGWTPANYDSVRGLVDHRGILYGVLSDATGSSLLSWTRSGSTYTATVIDSTTITTSSGLVRIAAANHQIMIVDGTNGYIYDIDDATFAKITDTDFPSSPADVTYQDGYFIVVDNSDHKFYISALNEGRDWDALDFASATAHPDKLVGCISDHREVWLFGEKSTEIWFNSGNATFPFERRPGVLLHKGLAARDSLVRADNSLYWLARDEAGQAIVVRADGYTPKIISSVAVSQAIESYTTISDAFGYHYMLGSNAFYVLTFPTEQKTWMYNANNGTWCELRSLDGTEDTRHRSNTYAFSQGKHVVGDFESGSLFELDEDTYTDNSDRIRRVRRTPHLNQGNNLISLYNLTLEIEPGVGNYSGDGVDPEVMLRISKDGGHTWGNEMRRKMGVPGEYLKRVKWDSLGQARNWAFEFVVTDPVKAVILGAYVDVEESNS